MYQNFLKKKSSADSTKKIPVRRQGFEFFIWVLPAFGGSGVPHFAHAHSSAPYGRSRTPSAVLHTLALKAQQSSWVPRKNHRFFRDSLKTHLVSFAGYAVVRYLAHESHARKPHYSILANTTRTNLSPSPRMFIEKLSPSSPRA